MIDFNTSQLTWIVIGLSSVGGTGYMSLTSKVDELSAKIMVINTQLENTNKSLDRVQEQLDRIERKVK